MSYNKYVPTFHFKTEMYQFFVHKQKRSFLPSRNQHIGTFSTIIKQLNSNKNWKEDLLEDNILCGLLLSEMWSIGISIYDF